MALDRSFAFCLDDVVCDWFCFFLVGAFCICMFWLRSKFAPPKTPSLLPSYPLLPPHTIAVAADAVDSVAAGAGGSGSAEGGEGGGRGASGVVVIVSADPVGSAGVNAGFSACLRADVGASGSGARVDASRPPPPHRRPSATSSREGEGLASREATVTRSVPATPSPCIPSSS